MSSYADVAASSGPTGAEKLPEPAKVERTTEPLGSVETVDEKEFARIKKQALKAAKDAVDSGKEHVQDFKKELKELEKESQPYVDQAVSFVKEKYARAYSYITSYLNKDTVNAAGQELQNPAVIGQLALIAGGATAGWFVYSERARINTDNKYVIGIHAGLVTALVLADVYVFQKVYPKYK